MPDYEFAGDHMKMAEDENGNLTVTFSAKPSGRVCGSCTLCCTLVPVPEIHKPAGRRCPAVRYGKGCTVYADRPTSCRSWACRWLIDASTAGLSRPDRAHYVIDMTLDYVRMRHIETGVVGKVPMLQVWCDPAFPNAHRDPPLRAWLARQAEQWGCGALVRFGNERALALFPPAIADDRAWHEVDSSLMEREPEHALEDVADVQVAPLR